MFTFSSKYMVQFLYVSSKNLNFTKRYLRKKIIKIHKNISWYYTKSINWGHTSNFIDNFKKMFVCWNKILENTIQNNLLKPRKFLRQIIHVVEFRSSKALTLRFTVISLVIQTVMIFRNFAGISRIQSIVYNLRVLGNFDTENYAWKFVIIESLSEFWQFFLYDIFLNQNVLIFAIYIIHKKIWSILV